MFFLIVVWGGLKVNAERNGYDTDTKKRDQSKIRVKIILTKTKGLIYSSG